MTYRIQIGRFGLGRGYISTGIAEIYSSYISGSDIHYRMLTTMVLSTFLLKCCVMTQQEGIIRLRELTSASCQSMAHIAIYRYVNLYTRIRAARPSTCNVVRNAFGHLIIEHLIISKPMDGSDSYIYSNDRYGSKVFISTIPTPLMAWRWRSRTWKFKVEVNRC